MPDAFFANSKKRKRPQANARNTAKHPVTKLTKATRGAPKQQQQREQKRRRDDDEELSDGSQSNIDDLDLRASDEDPNESDKEEYANETPAEKRLRLAKVYLDTVKEDIALAEGEHDAAEIDRDIISSRLKEDVLENAGKLHIHIADSLNLARGGPSHIRIKPHRFAVTAAVLSDDSNFLYTSGKEGTISCYDISSKKVVCRIPKLRNESKESKGSKGKGKAKAFDHDIQGHVDEVLALAISGDGKYLVSGGRDRRVCVWNIKHGSDEGPRLTWLRGFTGHKDTISGLTFRKSTNTLYSSSFDRTVKIFDLSPGVMGYVETLFGHQEGITDLDGLKGDTAVTVAGRDRTVRFWKIAEESQLVFRGGGTAKSKMRDLLETGLEMPDEEDSNKKRKNNETWIEGSIDCVGMIDENTFVSGGDSGTISLWSTTKKKPVFSYSVAHGLEETESSTEGTLRRPRWITSIGCLRYGDVFVSGSWDGHIRLWKVHSSLRSFAPLGALEAHGIVNSLRVTQIPKDWALDQSWTKETITNENGAENGNGNHHEDRHTITTRKDVGILVTAGLGQEPRIGRWIKLKGDGAVNCAVIFAIRKDSH